MKIKSSFFTTLLGASMLLTGVAHAATINVPADNATIQGAVNSASPGDTVNVSAGTYNENVQINKSLTLQGAGSAITTIDGGGIDATIQVTASNVTIDGFTIRGGQNNLNSGIWSQASNTGLTITHNLITDNTIGVYAQCGGSCLIQNNVFDGNNRPGASGGSGIYVENSNGLTIDSNEFKNHSTNNPVIFAEVTSPAHTSLVFTNNNVHDNFSGIYALGISGGTFTGNIATAPGATAFSFGGDNHNVSVTQNTITNSDRGIRFSDDGVGPNDTFTTCPNTFSGNTQYNVGQNPGGYNGTIDDCISIGTPVVTVYPPHASTTPVTVSGTTDASTTVYIVGNGSTTTASSTGATTWSSLVALMQNALNHFTITASDGTHTSSSTSIDITHDNVRPVIATSSDVMGVEATTTSGASATYTTPTVTDNLDNSATASCSPESTSLFAIGSTTVTCMAVDNAGNSATSTTFTVNVVDNEPNVPPTQPNPGGRRRNGGIPPGLLIAVQNTNPNSAVAEVLAGFIIDGNPGRVLGASTFRFFRNLKKGDRGDDVAELQARLIGMGFLKAGATGLFGNMTATALKAFQRSVGVPPTGNLGPMTENVLNNS